MKNFLWNTYINVAASLTFIIMAFIITQILGPLSPAQYVVIGVVTAVSFRDMRATAPEKEENDE